MAAQANAGNSQIPVTRKGRKKRVVADRQEVIRTAEVNPNLSHQDIATLHNVERSTVSKILADYSLTQSKVNGFKEQRADILAGLQARMLISITDEDIKKMPGGSRVLAAAQLFDKERLERDLSTSNVASVHADIAAIKALQDLDKPE